MFYKAGFIPAMWSIYRANSLLVKSLEWKDYQMSERQNYYLALDSELDFMPLSISEGSSIRQAV